MRRNIVHVIDGLGTGGAEHSLAELLPALEAAGFDPILVPLYRRGVGAEQSFLDRYDVRYAPNPSAWPAARFISKIARENAAALIHTSLFRANTAGRLAGALCRVPVLTSLVSTEYDKERLRDPKVAKWRLRAVQAFDAFSSRYGTRHFHAITHAVKDEARRALRIPAESITVVERWRSRERIGNYSDERRTSCRSALGLEEDTSVICTLGREEFQKGHVHLMDAIGLLRDRGRRLLLLHAGRRGHMSEAIDARITDLQLGPAVRRLGHIQNVGDLLCAADLFVFPSLWEGLGGATLEAMAMGLPIVASNVPALAEVTEEGKNALLAPPGDAVALADAIDTLLSNAQLRKDLGARSLQIFEDRFSKDELAQRMVDVFERVARS